MHSHADEICYWTKHKNETKVWYKSEFTDGWTLVEPKWNGTGTYIVDNMWAELRKVQADGKQLQYKDEIGNWVNGIWNIKSGECYDWRIKPEPIYEWQYISYDEDYDRYKISDHMTDKERAEYINYDGKKYEPSKRERK